MYKIYVPFILAEFIDLTWISNELQCVKCKEEMQHLIKC